MAKWIEHTLKIHTNLYQKYMDASSYDLEFDAVFGRE
jgi:hypothetical protein